MFQIVQKGSHAKHSKGKRLRGALYSSNVWVTPVLDMLARPCISPMWLIYLGLAKLCIPQMSGWHLCWMCWEDLASSVKERSKENKGIVWVLRGLCKFCKIASSVKERSKENEGIVWVPNGLSKFCRRANSVKEKQSKQRNSLCAQRV